MANDQTALRAFIVACALLYLPVGLLQRSGTVFTFVSDQMGQQPGYRGREPRVIFIDPTRMFYGADLIQNDAFLRGDVVRMMSRDPAANAALMADFKPNYHRVLAVPAGEVWSAAAPAP